LAARQRGRGVDRRAKKRAVANEAAALAVAEERRKVGRPTEYSLLFSRLAEKFCLLGATDDQIAECLSISVRTLNNWKRDHPEFMQSIKRGKEFADARVADALYRRAVGYECSEFVVGKLHGRMEVMPIPKHIPPDPGAAIFWLKNRQPHLWGDRREYVVKTLNVQVNGGGDWLPLRAVNDHLFAALSTRPTLPNRPIKRNRAGNSRGGARKGNDRRVC
jgi:hypothetical protein